MEGDERQDPAFCPAFGHGVVHLPILVAHCGGRRAREVVTDLRKIQQSSANDSLFKLRSGETVDRHSGSLSELPGHLKRRDRLSRPVPQHRYTYNKTVTEEWPALF